jgi:uncharacterized protein (DUF885 family)
MSNNFNFHCTAVLRSIAAVCALCFVAAVPAAAACSAGSGPNAEFTRQFGAAFLDHYWHLHSDAAISVGYYKVAGVLIVPDDRARAEELRFLRSSLAALQRIAPDALDAATRTDRAVLEIQLQGEIWYLTKFRDWEWNPSLYNVAEPFALLSATEYAPLEVRLRAVLARLANVPAYYAAAKSSIKNPTREHTELAIKQNSGALEVFGPELGGQIARASLTHGERALFTKRIAAARAAITDYISWLKAEDQALAGGTPRSFRIGLDLYEPKFSYDIASGSTASALYERAQQEKERMDLLADELWPKYFPDAPRPDDRLDKIGTLIDKMSEQHIARTDLFKEVSRTIPELEQWVTVHNLVKLDTAKPLQVRITPKYKQGVAGASVDAPGPYDADARTYFNVTPLDDLSPERAESSLREYNLWMLPILVIHEAVPGHYVQLEYANRSPSLIKSLFGNGAMIEGWAVYGERMMLESGYGEDSAEEWLIYSKWNLRSVSNTILDYSVHVLGMSEADAKRFLSHEAFQSDEEVREKWRRVTLTSVQLTSYFAGYSAIYDFRERLKKQHPGQFDLKRFHEQFLSYGSAPVRVIEEMMTGAGS